MKQTKGVAIIVMLLILGALLHLDVGYVQGGPTYVDKSITTDTIWNYAGSPYILIKDISVFPIALLVIEPGVTVEFADGTSLQIFGGLRAQGNTSYPITFTSNSSTPTPGIWDRIVFAGGKEFSMGYAVIEYANTGLELVNGASISDSKISNCNAGIEGNLTNANEISVTDNIGDGLRLDSTSNPGTFVEKSNISRNGGYGILVTGSSTIYLNCCAISNNARDGIVLSSGGTIENSLISGNIGNGTCILGPTTMKDVAISDNGGDGILAESSMSITGCNVTGNAKNGISCDHTGESVMLQRCHLSYNIGDGIWTSSSVEIDGTDIIFNDGNGVSAAAGVNMTISSSNILNNTLNGLEGRGYVSTSNVTGNKLCGILGNFTIEYYSNITWNTGGGFNGTGRIYWCSIFSNTPYDAVSDIWPNNTTATYNWWGTNEPQMIQEHIYDHNDTESLGYVVYDNWLSGVPQVVDHESPEIVEVMKKGTSPEPYVPWPKIRMNEPVAVSANVTDNHSPTASGVDKVFLSYRVNGSEWCNTTMVHDGTTGYWVFIIPAQRGNLTVEFFVEAYDKSGNQAVSPIYSFTVKDLPIGDVNGDCSVDMADISISVDNFMQATPP